MQDENIGLNTQEYIEKGGKETKTGSRKSQEDAWRCNYKIKQEITQQKKPWAIKVVPFILHFNSRTVLQFSFYLDIVSSNYMSHFVKLTPQFNG